MSITNKINFDFYSYARIRYNTIIHHITHVLIMPLRFTLLLLSMCLLATGCNNTATHTQPSSTPHALSLHPTQTVTLGDFKLNVQVARTHAEQAQGLSHISPINDEQGMLFIFDPPKSATFWMKDMQFPLDIIWIRNGHVVGISPQLATPSVEQTLDSLPRYTSPTTVDAAIEVNAGWATTHNIHIGDELDI